MALNKKTPQFEGQEAATVEATAQGVVAAESPSETSTESAAPASAEATSTKTEVAVRPAASVSVNVKQPYAPAYADFEKRIDPATVQFNTFRRVTVGLDGFEDDQKVDLGKEIHLELMSFNSRWVVSPGVQDAEATELVKYSIDGKTIDGTGEDIHEYLKHLKVTEGYKDASIKEYLGIYGFMTYSNGKDVDMIDRSIVAVQVPPQSKAMFDRFRIESGFKIAAGAMQESSTLVLKQEKQQGKQTKFAVIRFSAK